MIGGPDQRGSVGHDDRRVAGRDQALDPLEEGVEVARVQARPGLVQHEGQPAQPSAEHAREAHALQLANDSRFGLGAAVWTRDVARAHRVAQKVRAGIVWINAHHRNDPSSPWGGFGHSGVGRENGTEALLEYTETQSVVVALDDAPFDWFAGAARYN